MTPPSRQRGSRRWDREPFDRTTDESRGRDGKAAIAGADLPLQVLRVLDANAQPLARLRAIVRARAELAELERELVQVATRTGPRPATWGDVGAALGISKSAAHRTYGGRR